MKNWLKLPIDKQIDLFNQLSAKTGIQPQAIEKDAWVTLILRMIFNSEISEFLVFKGGTSLSKAYNLIERFSEDIDISLDRKFLGFEGNISKGEIRKLRKESHKFVSTQMIEIIRKRFENHDIKKELFQIEVENTKISDQDPEIITINYQSVFDELTYIPKRVLIEIGARSLMEPIEQREIVSIIDEKYPKSLFSEGKFEVNTVIPEKTFLEKMILLHEEFQKPKEKVRYHRMSRHLYDIGQIITTEYGQKALADEDLFNKIIAHRELFMPIKTVDYKKLRLKGLRIIPPDDFLELYRKDYVEMQENMIYGKSLGFYELMELLNVKYAEN
jgi:hypothetical protein